MGTSASKDSSLTEEEIAIARVIFNAARKGDLNALNPLLDLHKNHPSILNWHNSDWRGITALIAASENDTLTDVIDLLLSTDGVDVNATDDCGWTALHHACYSARNTELILKAPGVNVSMESTRTWLGRGLAGCSPLDCANDEKIRELLLAAGARNGKIGSKGKYTEVDVPNDLWHLITGDNTNISDLTELLKKYDGNEKWLNFDLSEVDSGEDDSDYGTLLSRCRMNSDAVRLIVSTRGVDVNQRDMFGMTPLCLAAEENNVENVRILLSSPGIEINRIVAGSYFDAVDEGMTACHFAALYGNIEVLQLLLNHPGTNLEKPAFNRDDMTPLGLTLMYGQAEAASLLRNAGAREPEGTVAEAITRALTYVAEERERIKENALKVAADSVGLEIWHSVASNELVTLQQLLDDWKGNDIVNFSYLDNSSAVEDDSLIDIKNITKHSGSAELQGSTPLLVACGYLHQDCNIVAAQRLIKTPGIDINKVCRGVTPLMQASKSGCVEIVKILIACDEIDLNKVYGEESALDIALHHDVTDNEVVWSAKKEIASVLRAAGAQRHNEEEKSRKEKEEAEAKELEEKNRKLQELEENQRIARFIAELPTLVSSPPLNQYATRYTKKSPEEIRQNREKTASTWAMWFGLYLYSLGHQIYNECRFETGVSDVLLSLVDDWFANDVINWANPYHLGRTPLHAACLCGNISAIQLLIATPGIDINKVDKHGMTALMLATASSKTENRIECVRILLALPSIDTSQVATSGRHQGLSVLNIAEHYISERELKAKVVALLAFPRT